MSILISNFRFQASRLATLLTVAGGVIALVSLLIIPIPLLWQMPAAGLLVLLFAVAVYQRTLLKGKNAVWGIRFHKHNMVAVADRNDNIMDMGHISYCYVSQLLSTFIVEGKRRRYYVMLMPDPLPTEECHHLRIQLNTVSDSIQKNDRPPAAGAK